MFQADDPNTRMRKSNLFLGNSSPDNDNHDTENNPSHASPSSHSFASVYTSGSPASLAQHHDSNSNKDGDAPHRSPSKSRGSASSWRTMLLQIFLAFRGLSLRQRCLLGGVILLCTPYAVHRAIVKFKGSKTWVFSPNMHTERKCPAPGYPTIGSAATENKRKICLTTLTDEKTKHSVSLFRRFIRWRNYDNILELTWKSKQAYADKHGYHLFDSSDIVEKGRPAQWSKIKAVQRLFVDENCDWVLWMDADTLFMNSEKKIEDFLPSDPDKDLVIARDVPNPGYNSGSWLVKNSEWGRTFLQKWWDMKTFVRLPGQSLSGDNDAFKVLLDQYEKDEFEKHVAVPPRCTINAFAKFLRPWEMDSMTKEKLQTQSWYMSENFYHKGDWLVHVPGYDNKAGTLQMLIEEIQ